MEGCEGGRKRSGGTDLGAEEGRFAFRGDCPGCGVLRLSDSRGSRCQQGVLGRGGNGRVVACVAEVCELALLGR